VREGSRLSQIRFRRGHALLGGDALRELHARERLVDTDAADVSEGVAVGVDLSGTLLSPTGGAGIVATAPSAHRPDRCPSARRLQRARLLSRCRRAPTRA